MTQNSEGEYAFLIFDPGGSLRFGVGTTKRGFVGLNVRDGHGVVIRSNLYANDDGSDTASEFGMRMDVCARNWVRSRVTRLPMRSACSTSRARFSGRHHRTSAGQTQEAMDPYRSAC